MPHTGFDLRILFLSHVEANAQNILSVLISLAVIYETTSFFWPYPVSCCSKACKYIKVSWFALYFEITVSGTSFLKGDTGKSSSKFFNEKLISCIYMCSESWNLVQIEKKNIYIYTSAVLKSYSTWIKFQDWWYLYLHKIHFLLKFSNWVYCFTFV